MAYLQSLRTRVRSGLFDLTLTTQGVSESCEIKGGHQEAGIDIREAFPGMEFADERKMYGAKVVHFLQQSDSILLLDS